MSTCTGFAAIAQANTKFAKGYAVTGVGMVVCARHGMILPNAIGDLQKGERYVSRWHQHSEPRTDNPSGTAIWTS